MSHVTPDAVEKSSSRIPAIRVHKIEHGFRDEHPNQKSGHAQAIAQRNNRDERQDHAGDVAGRDLIPRSIGHCKSEFLRGEDLERNVPKGLDPKQRSKRVGSAATFQPWYHVPSRH